MQRAGKFREAEKAFRAAITIWENRVAESPEVAYSWVNLSWNYDGLGQVLQATGQVNEAEKAYRRALAIWEKLGTDGPDRRDARRDAARLRGLLGSLFAAARRTREAEEAYGQARAAWKKLAADFPSEPGYLSSLAYVDWNLGNLLRDTGRAQEAEQAYRRALAIYEKLVADYPGEAFYRHEQAFTYWLLGGLLRDTGRAQEAEQAYRRAVSVGGNLVANDPDNAGFRGRLSTYLGELAKSLLQQGKHAEAAKVAEKIPGALPQDATGYQSAALVLARCVALAEKDAGLPEADRKALARAYAERSSERMREALTLPSKVIEVGSKDGGLWARRGQLYCELGQWDKAAADYARATEANPTLPPVWYQYAMVRLGAADAKGYRGVCAGILERLGKTEDPEAAYWVAWSCVVVPDAVTRPAPLVPLAEKAVARAPTNYDYRNTLGAALYRAGRFGEAVKRLDEAAAVYKPDSGCRQPLAYSWFFLAMAHHRLGHAEEARKWLDRAVRWTDQAGPGKGKGAAGTVPMPWNRRLTLQFLRREAETLIRGAATQK